MGFAARISHSAEIVTVGRATSRGFGLGKSTAGSRSTGAHPAGPDLSRGGGVAANSAGPLRSSEHTYLFAPFHRCQTVWAKGLGGRRVPQAPVFLQVATPRDQRQHGVCDVTLLNLFGSTVPQFIIVRKSDEFGQFRRDVRHCIFNSAQPASRGEQWTDHVERFI